MKICSKCNKEKDVSEFSKNKHRPDGLHHYCKKCDSARSVGYKRANKNINNARSRDRRQRLKREVMNSYGGVCECCGESNLEFLTIDHIHGGGRHDVARVGGSERFYSFLKKEGFPKGDYRVLCFNCNFSIGAYGYCPHSRQEGVNSMNVDRHIDKE